MIKNQQKEKSEVVSHSPNISPLTLKPMQQNNNTPIAISIVIAGALIAGGIFLSSMYGPNKNSTSVAGIQGGQPAAPVDPYAANTELAKNVLPVSEEDHIIGNRDAKVAIIEYSDLDCPFCQKIHSTLQQITKDYDKNEVVWVYRHLPLPQLHPYAPAKAEASECAAKLGGNSGFWKFVDTYNKNQDASGGEELILDTAVNAGFSRDEFKNCLYTEDFSGIIESHIANAQNSGGNGTPFSVIVSEDQFVPISGALPYDIFKTEIDKLLEN
ncbi:MAG: hypothetical protein COT91_05055 [Candidatus Doudnabacteria bacterium CG10_big_fil_rev_8_21_14_0_10_41_10]|uniref:Thioredoxin domain-containing protein n=1 Tax=Candidatus Doudnabacteria bacterium CG10_big_fil_rev_8_21_14_0_10_41_10 TaxID=1974551 RepID=A0A2H0VCE2_9BACT|nr:MAG: hypothetical protein COT91_05055 [Candidatus Doudnabacteria bacterium CG10_big_fil_rev_8_21_14_0_10_41_10]